MARKEKGNGQADTKSPALAENDRVAQELARPFHEDEINWKPQVLSKDRNRCLAIAYIDARAVMDRLDEVLGPFGWSDHYEEMADGTVKCILAITAGGGWVSKEDVGSLSDQPDKGDKKKAAFSDALKRAAVKFGVGRYLYRLDNVWVDYNDTDKNKPAIPRPPTLPRWARHDWEPATAEQVDRVIALCKGADDHKQVSATVNTLLKAEGATRVSDLHRQKVEELIAWLTKQPKQAAGQASAASGSKSAQPA